VPCLNSLEIIPQKDVSNIKYNAITGDIEAARVQQEGGKQIASISGADAQSVFNNFSNIKAFVDEQNRINAQLSGLVPVSDIGSARSVVGSAIKTSGKDITGEQLVSDLINNFSPNQETSDLLNKELRSGSFSKTIDNINGDKAVRYIAGQLSLPHEIVEDENNIKKIRQARVQAAQEQAAQQEQLAQAEVVNKVAPVVNA
jgi:polyhydroxyalkanoate synthesis regulator protein